jgi:hypothetical protein
MRIATLVYGRLNKCVEHYNNIIEMLGINNNIDFFLSSDNSPPSQLDDFINLYKPVAHINDTIKYDYDLNKYNNKRPEVNTHNMTCHFINKNRVFSLLEDHINKNNIHYDIIVSLRIDLVIENCFNFDETLDNNTIYIPFGYDFIDNAINDQVAYGNYEVMKKYNSINPVELLEQKLSITHPESLTLANIKYHKLEIKRFSLQYRIER